MSYLEKGDIFETKIDFVSGSGNGMLEEVHGKELDGDLNIGPVKADSAGEIVKVEKIHPTFGRCLTESVRQEEYESDFSDLIPHRNHGHITSSCPVRTDGKAWKCPDCGSRLNRNSEVWQCRKCDYRHIAVRHIYDEEEDTSERNNESSHSTDSSTEFDQEASASDQANFESDLKSLREEAEESGNQDRSITQTATNQTKQYYRSTEVREYVMARADGTCEGCGEPAPFQSKTGEPYLHAHHINELSDGGSDTPETVAALCPNCHYEIHHGVDGEEYNEELAATIKQREQGMK